MKCYTVNGKGIEGIQAEEREAPDIVHPDDVLVQVKACSINYRDLMIAKGQYAIGNFPPTVALSDMAGIVLKTGKEVEYLHPGDHVINSPFRHWPAGKLQQSWASTFIGGMGVDGVLAEQIVYPASSLVKIPAYLDMAEAATFPIAGLTAWAAIVVHGKTRPGDWVLLQGTGGVSIFAAQLAKAIGANIVMTTSNQEKSEFVKSSLGVHATVNYRDADWAKQVKEITHGEGVDIVVDVAGGDTLAAALKICNFSARVAAVGVLDGQEAKIQVRDLLKRQITIRGIYMESTEELRALMKASEAIQLKPYIDRIFSLHEAKDAYRYLESQKHIGKIVLSL